MTVDLMDYELDDQGSETETFTIDTDQKARWAAKIIKEERNEADRVIALAKAEIERLHGKVIEYENSFDRRTANLKAMLLEYFGTVDKKTTKTQQTYDLVDYKLRLKKQNPEFVRDETKLTAWAKENTPELVKVKETTDWAALKKLTAVQGENVVFLGTGEVIDGITANEREDVFEVIW